MAYRKTPKAISELLTDYVQDFPHRRALKRGLILAELNSIVGDKIAEQIQRSWFKGNKLCIKINSQVWRQELHAQRHSILKKLNARAKEDIISEIVVY